MGGGIVIMSNYNLLNRFHIMDMIEPGLCPNFYLSGKSISLLEETTVELTTIIERKKLIEFKGLMPCFSILMPYYDSVSKASQFMSRLMDSYSIARDCYDLYKGIIVIECSEDWSEFGYNCSVELLTSFISKHKEVCFFILMPEKKETRQRDILFGELTKNQLWIRYECETLNILDCITLFCDEAEALGYFVTEDAKDKLVSFLRERSEFLTDNKTTVMQLVKQIQLNKLLNPNISNQICEKDINIVSGLSERINGAGIGFNSKIR